MTAVTDSGATSSRVCYVVLCHDDAAAALSLAVAIRRTSPEALVLIRHDQPAGFLDPTAAQSVGADLLRSDVTVRWGGWSLVEAMLEAAQHAVDTLGAGLVVLVSGRDRPVRHLGRWERQLLDDGVDALLDISPSHDPARHRYSWRTWSCPAAVPGVLGTVARVAWEHGPSRWQRQVVAYPTSRDGIWAVGWRRRRDPVEALGLAYVKGAQWMVLSAAAVRVVSHADTAVAQRTFAGTRIPDEAYVHTVVTAAEGLRVRQGPTTYAVFPPGQASPRLLRPEDVPAARHSGAAFARKVSSAPEQEAVVAEMDRAAEA